MPEQPGTGPAQQDRQLDVQLNAAGIQITAVQDQLFHPFGKIEGEQQRDIGPIAEAQKVSAGNLFLVHEFFQVSGELSQ